MSKKITKTTKATKGVAKTVKKAPDTQPVTTSPKAKAKVAKDAKSKASKVAKNVLEGQYYALFDLAQLDNSSDTDLEMDHAFRGLYTSVEDAIRGFATQRVELENELEDLYFRGNELIATLHDVEDEGWKIMPMRPEPPFAGTKAVAGKTKAKKQPAKKSKKSAAKKTIAKKPKAFTGPLPKILSIGFLTDEVLEKYVPNLKNATKLDVELTWQPRIHTVDVDISVWYKSAKSSIPIEGEDGSNEDLASDLYDAIRATLMSRFSAAPNMGPSEAEAFFEREAAPLFATTRKLAFDTSTGSDS